MENKDIVSVYDRIKELCKKKGVTQTKMCNDCGINAQSHRGRITKKVAPDVFDAFKIAQYLGTSVEYLITGEENNPLAEENRGLKEKIKSIAEITKG